MSFGIGDITRGIQNAVKSAGDAVGQAAHQVESTVQDVEKKVADVVKSAVQSLEGKSGFDDDQPGHGNGEFADSKPKGTGGTQVA